jgi:hypothetical protein
MLPSADYRQTSRTNAILQLFYPRIINNNDFASLDNHGTRSTDYDLTRQGACISGIYFLANSTAFPRV